MEKGLQKHGKKIIFQDVGIRKVNVKHENNVQDKKGNVKHSGFSISVIDCKGILEDNETDGEQDEGFQELFIKEEVSAIFEHEDLVVKEIKRSVFLTTVVFFKV